MTAPSQICPSPFWRRALVVFSGRSDLAWLRWLRPGFRHCFLVLEGQDGWLCVNPLAHHTLIQPLRLAPDFDPAAWYRRMGMRVLEAPVHTPRRRALGWRPFTCVEAVKRVLGIQTFFILTPWQLYRYIEIERTKSLTSSAGPS